MINKSKAKEIYIIWDNYLKSNRVVKDSKGKPIKDINESRIASIKDIKQIIDTFLNKETTIYEFKTTLDSYNKRNNLWGFTAIKGQMFFNQLVRVSEHNINKLTDLLKQVITEPKNLEDALNKIDVLESFCVPIFKKAKDKRKAPNPSSIGYFISYFWQIHNNEKWPIIYTSIINAFKKLAIWEEHSTQSAAYKYFYILNEEVKTLLDNYSKQKITNWEVEHALWDFTGKPSVDYVQIKNDSIREEVKIEEKAGVKANFELKDYLIPKVANLMELGKDINKSSSEKGTQYEKLVAEIFNQLDFDVDLLGQGKGREPDAIIKYREENTAFLVDAKAYSSGYSLGIDDRAIKEYINHHCPKLYKDGFKKIGFIIVSNSFKSDFDSFINDITWNSEIKRFILLTSEALLYLLAYKTKDKLSISNIIESLIEFGNIIEAKDIIEKYDDI